jgi:superfamily II DNA helicase RecQ
MDLRIFTLPFDPGTEGFPDEVVRDFCLNKKVHSVQTQFFLHEGRPFWSVAVQYDVLLQAEQEKAPELDEVQRQLYLRLKAWRKQQGDKEGVPAFILASNQQLITMVRLKTQSLEMLKRVKGFGAKRIQKHGKQIVAIIKAFYEEHKAAAPENTAKEEEEDDKDQN